MNDNAGTTVERVECRASKDSAVRLFIGAAALIAVAVWCIIDRHKYPPPEQWTLEYINEAAEYALNHFGPWLFIPVGVLLAVLGVLSLRRFVIADSEGIVVNNKPKIAWGEFTGIDASLLEKKGILMLKRGAGPGAKLNRYHYANFRDLVAFIEQRVKVES